MVVYPIFRAYKMSKAVTMLLPSAVLVVDTFVNIFMIGVLLYKFC